MIVMAVVVAGLGSITLYALGGALWKIWKDERANDKDREWEWFLLVALWLVVAIGVWFAFTWKQAIVIDIALLLWSRGTGEILHQLTKGEDGVVPGSSPSETD